MIKNEPESKFSAGVMSAQQKKAIFLAYISLLVLGLADNMRGPLFPDLLRYFNLDNAEGSLFFSIASAMVLPGGFITGYFLDHWGRRKSLRFSLLILTLALFGLFISSSFAWILVTVFFFGAAMGMMNVVQNVMVIEAAPPVRLQKFQAGLHSMYGLASLSAPLLVNLVHSLTGRWQASFLVGGILGVLVLALTFIHADFESPREAKVQTITSSSMRREVFYFGFVIASYVAMEIMLSTRIAQFTRNVAGWSFESTNNLNTFFFVGMFLGRLIFIFWRPSHNLKLQLSVSLVLGMLFIILGIWLSPLFFVLAGLSIAPFYPVGMTAVGRMFPQELNSVTSKAVAFSGITVVLMQTMLGFFGDWVGLSWAMLAGPFFGLIALVMILSYRKIFGRDLP